VNNKPKTKMILHTITLSNCATGEQSTRHITRARQLTYLGAERILRRNGMSADLTVVRIETAIYA
jgi:hypothetical protein